MPGPSWPAEAPEMARRLHQALSLGDRDWHALKGDRRRRAAEQLSAALCQLLAGGSPAEVVALSETATGWLRGELRDPGCPDHRPTTRPTTSPLSR
jgi:hypothetical protein